MEPETEGSGPVKTEGAGPVKYVCIFFPPLGLILYLLWKDERPKAASECGVSAQIGVATGLVLWLFQKC